MSLQFVESPTLGRVWLVQRWVEARHLPTHLWPVFHQDEVKIIAKLAKRPVCYADLARISEIKRIFGKGTIVTEVYRRFRAYAPRGRRVAIAAPRYTHAPPEAYEMEDGDD